jgi:hypothetical protein
LAEGPKAIERKILGYFQREFSKTGAKFLAVKDLGDKGLDFLLTLPGGETYLELMELVAPEIGETPYQHGAQSHTASGYIDKVFHGVERKIAKYGLKHDYPIHLLFYTTHEQYVPSPPGVEMLKIRFKETVHPFENVFLITPLAEDLTPLQVQAIEFLKKRPKRRLSVCQLQGAPSGR